MQLLTHTIRNIRRFFGGPAHGQTMDISSTARVGDTVNVYHAPPLRRDREGGVMSSWPGLVATPYKVGLDDCTTPNN